MNFVDESLASSLSISSITIGSSLPKVSSKLTFFSSFSSSFFFSFLTYFFLATFSLAIFSFWTDLLLPSWSCIFYLLRFLGLPPNSITPLMFYTVKSLVAYLFSTSISAGLSSSLVAFDLNLRHLFLIILHYFQSM